MKTIKTLIEGELLKLMQDKTSLLSGVFVMLVWVGISIPNAISSELSIMNTILFMSTMVGFFMVYLFASLIFLNEKRQKTIETLLCAPVSLRELWLGKSITVTILAFIGSLVSALLISIATSILSASTILPEISLLVYLVIVLPLLLLSVSGLFGFLEFVMGMKENKILSFLVFFFIFGFFGFLNSLVRTMDWMNWIFVSVAAAITILLLGISFYASGFISKEKIVTTLE